MSSIRMRMLVALVMVAALLALGVRDPGPQADDEPERLTVSFEDRGERRGKGDRRAKNKPRTFEGDGTMYRVEVGRRDGVSPGAIGHLQRAMANRNFWGTGNDTFDSPSSARGARRHDGDAAGRRHVCRLRRWRGCR